MKSFTKHQPQIKILNSFDFKNEESKFLEKDYKIKKL
jgi:hypothetical protein